jgi:hypothetical protein
MFNPLGGKVPNMDDTTIGATANHRGWLRVAGAAGLSTASAFAYLGYVGQGIAFGAVLGLPGHEQDAAIFQHRAMYWFIASLFCQAGSIAVITRLLPFASDASALVRLLLRLFVAAVLSVLLTVVLATVTLSIAAALHGPPH